MRLWTIILALAGTCTMLGLGSAEVSDAYLPTWLETRVAKLEFHFRQREFDRIGWATTIEQAFQLAQKHDRPVMLFTHDGRINVGRC